MRSVMAQEHPLLGLAHDLRAPLRTLEGELELLLARNLDNGAREGAQACLRLAQGARSLFEDVLALAVGRAPGPVDVGALAHAVRTELSAAVVIEGEAVVRADARAVRRILGNLIANGALHGQAPIIVRVGPTGIVVQDAGGGLPKPMVDALSGGKPVPRRGTHGLGLHLTRLLAEGEGWRLTVVGPWPAVQYGPHATYLNSAAR